MCVYHGDHAPFFKTSLESVFNQTRQPDEVVLVVDGPVGDEINEVISLFENSYSNFKVIRLKINSGHAIARQRGLDNAKYEYIAIMDSDDIAVPGRFKTEMDIIEKNPDIDVLGGETDSFIGEPGNIVEHRVLPYADSEIKQYMRKRCPMSMVTTIIKKDSAQKVGGFLDLYCEEDYYLWVRMALYGFKFRNIDKTLVLVRTGNDQYSRRGGIRYFKSEETLQRFMLSNKMISLPLYLYNVIGRFVVQVVMPTTFRAFIYQKLLS